MPEPQDDISIGDDETLLRRIRPNHIHLDPITNQYRPESGCFRSDDFISVHIASLTSHRQVLSSYPDFSLVEITAQEIRSVGCKIVRNPLPEDSAHALIYGTAPGGYVSKPQAKKLAKLCRWVVLNRGQ
jgi:hypothetical protein